MNWKHYVFLFSILLLSLGVKAQSYRVSSSNGINLREDPSSSSDAITTIGNGERVRVIEKTNDKWYKVEYDGETGYVSAAYLEKDNGSNNNNYNDDDNRDRSNSNRNNNNRNSRKNSSRRNSDSDNSGSSKGGSVKYNWGIGLRAGDPTGLTVKKYYKKSALEFSIGRAYMLHNDDYHDRRHDYWYEDWHRDYPYHRDYQYLGYTRESEPIGMQLHYVFQKAFKNTKNRLFWYLGMGGQFRHQSYSYSYRYRHYNSNVWYYGEERVTDIDLGLDGVFGIEFFIPETPLSIFGDVTLFTEFTDEPVYFWLQGGIGGRINFK